MTLTGLSDNVGSCQALLSALLYALKEERHFALLDGVAFPNRRLARNPFRSGHSVRPMHLFGRTRDHDYYFELPRKRGERAAQSITRCWTAHHGLFRAGPRANRIFSLARNPIPYATSNTEQSPGAARSRPWRSADRSRHCHGINYTHPPVAGGSMSAIEDVTPTIGLINQLAASAAAADSSRRQIDNPGAPSANAPRVAGSGVWLLKAAVGSGSSGPLVAPATIDLPGMVS